MTSTFNVLDQIMNARKTGSGVTVLDPAKPRRFVVGCYERISDDQEDEVTGDRGAGVRRQAVENRKLCEYKEWDPAPRLYQDNDLSAFKDNVVRPDFEDLLEDLEAGVIDGIAVYNLDRFVRRPNDLERAIKIYDEARRAGRQLVFGTKEGDLDLSSDSGMTMARVMVAFANKSSRDTARRVADKHRATREEGRPVGGGRPFGWDWQRDEATDAAGLITYGKRRHIVNELESDAIRWAADILTSGEGSWKAVIEEWNRRGLRTGRGNEWVPQTVKYVMRSPKLAGWMTHREQIAVHSQTGQLIRGQWVPILSDDEYEALMMAIYRTNVGTGNSQAGRRKYLLSGIARCANCLAKLDGNAHTAGKYFYYVCRKSRHTNGKAACGKVGVSGLGLDALIEELLLPRIIADTTPAALLEGSRPHDERLIEIRSEIDRLMHEYRQTRLSSETVFPVVSELEREAEQLKAEQVRWGAEQSVQRRAVGVTEESWRSGAISLGEKRAHVLRHIESVFVAPATRKGNRFDPERVLAPVWRKPVER